MSGNNMMLDEFTYYKAHQDEIIAGHIGEIAIIKDHAVKGYYQTMDEALEAVRDYPIETYLLKGCRRQRDVVTAKQARQAAAGKQGAIPEKSS
ncbi:MAG: hypothetical protein LBU17_00200 [Treponema sp.]|jgi:hypothetical protein|nr:hypothetical protein [Treponema sp.]